MDGLRVTPGPGAPRGLTVPAGDLVERFSRSSGPGGQHVNTADSRVQLSIDLGTTTALDEVQRERALRTLAPKLSGTVLDCWVLRRTLEAWVSTVLTEMNNSSAISL